MTCLTCENLSIGYSGTPVASGISFSVSPGDLLCILGENGIGKSTLVKTLLRLLPPISGKLELSGYHTGCGVGYLPQRGETQRDFPASAGEIALSGRLARIGARPFFGKADRDAARDALKRVGALELHDQPFNQLSGGQQQRVLLARALCAASRIVVLDEPTTGLDPDAAKSLYELLETLRADGLAVIMVSHDVDEALSHATHVLAFEADTCHYFAKDDYLSHLSNKKDEVR
ncbi:MAG: ABC transporter ATP-binding protein [Coriobacteriales bacterium]|nr:ABC transporter ATP-binding protein [Coriobacteriales bacterium]